MAERELEQLYAARYRGVGGGATGEGGSPHYMDSLERGAPPPPLGDPPLRRPQPLMPPGFSYIYPNPEGGGERGRRRGPVGVPPRPAPPAPALPFRGKLEFFDLLSRGSTPEPGPRRGGATPGTPTMPRGNEHPGPAPATPRSLPCPSGHPAAPATPPATHTPDPRPATPRPPSPRPASPRTPAPYRRPPPQVLFGPTAPGGRGPVGRLGRRVSRRLSGSSPRYRRHHDDHSPPPPSPPSPPLPSPPPPQHLAGDAASLASCRSSSLPRPPAPPQHAHPPDKFWTFTTSVVLPPTPPPPAITADAAATLHHNTGYPDQPERDSLDGRLPGSSHGGTGNPPPPPAPPSPPPPTSGFSKGPNAKSKKHKKLKHDREASPAPPGPPSSSTARKGEKGEKGRERDMEEGGGGGGFRPKTQPYTYLWVVLSGLYGKVIVLLMLAFTLTEVLHNEVLPFTFQGVFLMYLYVGSILAILCIYVTVIIDNCPSVSASKENLTRNDDAEVGSITSFGTLKRAHISRSKTSRTSFYLRVGALVFGLGTLIFNGLEIAMHSTLQSECVRDVVFAHPILQALFTFLQMHFLFVNSEVIVERFGQVARFGFMHLVATNLAVWVRAVVWDAATVWMLDTYSTGKVTEVPPQAEQVLRMHTCFQNNSLGRLWTDAQPYLFPFLVQYSLIAAAVTYVMWCNVGKEKLKKMGRHSEQDHDSAGTMDKREVRKGYWKVDCRSASKGLFLGLLCFVGGVVVLIIFLVMKGQVDFRERLFWLTTSTHTLLLSLSVLVTGIGFLQVPKLSLSTSSSRPLDLDKLLLSSTILGVYVFAIFGMIVGGTNYSTPEYLAAFCLHALLLVQVSLQDMLVAEASRRTCTSRYQMLTKPGRQVITFLLFSNITLWGLDTFMTHSKVSQEFQYGFYGLLAWGVISRVSLPLLILYRFHSGVILVEIWKNTYRTKAD